MVYGGTKATTWYYYNSASGSSTGTNWWWLLSPGFWNGSVGVYSMYGSSNAGSLTSDAVNKKGAVRPVISLKSCVKTSGGDGSATNPYTIQETTSGC